MVNSDGKCEQKFTRIYKRNNDDSFERIYTYDGIDYNSEGYLIDKSIYVDDKNMIYVVDELITNVPIMDIKGICFENTQIDISQYRVKGINLYEYEGLIDNNTVSAIIFNGVVEDQVSLLEIYKNDECINIKYHKNNIIIGSDNNVEVLFENIEIPITNEGKISVLEINSIIKELKKDTFINVVIGELNRFSKKIYIKDRLMEEEYNPLSPKILLDKDFDIIADIIEKNKDGYIRLISEEFNLIAKTNIKKR